MSKIKISSFWGELVVVLIICCCSLSAQGKYGGGTGEPNDPYLIYDANHMQAIGAEPNDWDKHFKLMADIDMSAYAGTQYNIIGNIYYDGSFTGVFDGNRHTIQNLTYYTAEEKIFVGLFGGAYGATIKNLCLENVNISSAGSWVGGLLGFNWGSTIEKCSVQGNVSGGRDVGLLVGCNDWIYYTTTGLVYACFAEGTVSGESQIGGLVGVNTGNIVKCSADVAVTGANSVGGLAGENWVCSISDSYAMGSVTGQEDVGGLVGHNGKFHDGSGWDGNIQNCYSIGSTSGVTNAGGLIGHNGGGNIVSSFWDVNTSGEPNSAGGTGKTTEEMQEPNTFTDAGWDFTTPIWMICGQDYPKLIWNYPNINGDERVDFVDYSYIAEYWMAFNCGMCDGVDLTGNRDIDDWDLLVFTDHWLDEDEVSDHVFEIEINMGWDYEDPNDSNDTEYEFELWMGTDYRVLRVEFLTPLGTTFEIPQIPWQVVDVNGGYIETEWEYDSEDNLYGWMHYAVFNQPNDLAAYGDGQYTITVYYDNGNQDQTTVWFGIPETTDPIPQPIQEPNFVSFEHGAELTSPVTIEWQPCTDPAASLICVGLENQDTWEEYEDIFSVDVTGFDEPLNLSEGLWEIELDYEVWYNTQNNDGIDIWIGKYSESDYEFTVVP